MSFNVGSKLERRIYRLELRFPHCLCYVVLGQQYKHLVHLDVSPLVLVMLFIKIMCTE